jgi:carboxyl-terminal processing protease
MRRMKKSVLISVFSVIFAAVIFAGGFVLGYTFENSSFLPGFFNNLSLSNESDSVSQQSTVSKNSDIESIVEAFDFISANSLSQKTGKELKQAAVEGMLASLEDKHSDYFNTEEYKQIMESYSGTMSGIGVVVTPTESNEVLIINVIEGTPAFEKGLKAEDVITAVNGTNIKDKSIDEVVSMIKGKENTEVKLTIFRKSENKSYDFMIIRKKFYVPNFFVKNLEGNIVYIQYIDFQEKGAQNLGEKLNQLINDDTKGIIVDLRNNLGGSLDDAVNFCDLFLDSGVIVTVKGRTDFKDDVKEFSAKPGTYADIPMVVLINGYSASASELTAGALKDLGRAVLVGENSFGKGTVQILNQLPDGSGIKFTTAKYYLPSGITIDGKGIAPDVEVGLTEKDTVDVQLNKALEEVKKLAIKTGSK